MAEYYMESAAGYEPGYVYGAMLSSTRYDPGTAAWAQALQYDLSSGGITQAQYDWALKNPGMSIPVSVATTETSAWTSFWGGLSDTANVLFSSYAKYTQMEYQRNLLQQDVERRKLQLETGLPAPVGYGGINVYTLAALAGVALLAMLLLKKP